MSAMWDRFRGAVPQKHGRTQHPPSAQQQYYQQQYSQQPQPQQDPRNYAAGYSYSIQGGPPPPRPPREFVEQQIQNYYHNGPPPPQPPRQHDPHRDSSFRPPSSVYSQLSPLQTNFPPAHQKRNYTFNDTDEVSPLSAEEGDGQSQNISPLHDDEKIDENEKPAMMSQNAPGASKQGRLPNISSMRREKQQQKMLRKPESRERLRQPAEPRPDQSSGGRGWTGTQPPTFDRLTGEMRRDGSGELGQVKPAVYAKDISGSSPGQRLPAQQAQPRNASASFGERIRIRQPGFATGAPERAMPEDQVRPPQPQLASPTHDPAAGAFSADRPAWKGATGRTTIVPSVHDVDKKDVAPLNIPRKSSKRAGPRSPTVAGPAQGGSGLDTVMASPPGSIASPPSSPFGAETHNTIRPVVPSSQLLPSQQQFQQQAPARVARDPAADYPSPPYYAGDVPPLLNVETAAPEDSPPPPPPHLVQSPAALTPTTGGIRRKPAPAHQQQDSISSVYSQDPYNYNYNSYNSNYNQSTNPPQQDSEWVQPPSRFSVTTYATSAHSTPRPSGDGFDPSDAPPVPTMPRFHEDSSPSPPPPKQSILERSRPKLTGSGNGGDGSGSSGADDEPIVSKISLTMVNWRTGGAAASAPQQSQKKTMSADDARRGPGAGAVLQRRPSIESVAGSIYKTLPPAPPEMSAKDKVDQLQALRSRLGNRVINLDRSIRQMTELMPTDNIMASAEVLLKRESEKRKIEALKAELAQVRQEEYDLGMKLHRAYKRLEREDDMPKAELWVRSHTR